MAQPAILADTAPGVGVKRAFLGGGTRRNSGVLHDQETNVTNQSRPPVLSLVIPAYNEAPRLLATLDTATKFLDAGGDPYELLLVDDGSDDETAAIGAAFARQHPRVRLITIPHGGKAAATRTGITAAIGDLIAFSDADLATPLIYLADLQREIEAGAAVAIGTREGVGARRLGEPAYRHVMGRGFNWLVRLVVLPGIQDTQCGFKMFRRDAARAILDRARLYATTGEVVSGPRVTAFDVELLVVARRLGYRIGQVPVVWTYGRQSKVNPAWDTWHNFRDVMRVRLNDWRGRYR